MKQYQQKINDEKQNNLINIYIKSELNSNKKIKNMIEIALRKFILCFLTKEEKKEDKIKLNKNNIQNYLEIEDLWDRDFYKKNDFYQELKKLKNLGIKVNNVIPFYDKCFDNYYKNYFDDVETELKNKEEERKKEEKEKEKQDITNFNPKEYDLDENPQEVQEKNKEENTDNKNSNEDKKEELNEEEEDNGDSYIDEGVEEEEYGGRY